VKLKDSVVLRVETEMEVRWWIGEGNASYDAARPSVKSPILDAIMVSAIRNRPVRGPHLCQSAASVVSDTDILVSLVGVPVPW